MIENARDYLGDMFGLIEQEMKKWTAYVYSLEKPDIPHPSLPDPQGAAARVSVQPNGHTIVPLQLDDEPVKVQQALVQAVFITEYGMLVTKHVYQFPDVLNRHCNRTEKHLHPVEKNVIVPRGFGVLRLVKVSTTWNPNGQPIAYVEV